MDQPVFGIIPARYNSRRFPGKPLANILGRPMFWHVYMRAIESSVFQQIALATDSQEIKSRAEELQVPVLMTSSEHQSGTERVLEAAIKLQAPSQALIVNIQGDEPALEPAIFQDLLLPFKEQEVKVSTLVQKISADQAQNPNLVKVICSKQGKALYFSRAPIPYARENAEVTFWGHIGLYAFRFEALRKFCTLQKSPLEEIEKLEQLRLLEADIPIHVQPTTHASYGVDQTEDIAIVEKILQERQ